MTSISLIGDLCLILKYYFGRLLFYDYLTFFNPATGLFYSLPLQLYNYLTSYNLRIPGNYTNVN